MKKIKLLVILVGILACMQVAAFQDFVVKNIRINGLKRVSEGAVLEDLPVQIGTTITDEEASEAVRALYKSGFFKEVTLARDGNTLVVNVIERPTLSKLTITGIKDTEKVKKQLRELGLAEGQFYDPTILSRAEKDLERSYFAKGRYGVKIESKVTETSKSLVDVQLSIFEGDVARIREIKIIGNQAFPEKVLLKEFRLSKTNWLSWFKSDDQYNKEKLNADLENLRSYYMDRGYLHFQIDSTPVSLSADKKHIFITVNITEGDKYFFGSVGLEGPNVVPRKELIPLLAPLKPGSTFSRRALLDVKSALENRLGDAGYSMAEMRPDHEINETCKEVNIVFQIIPGKRMYVRRLLIQGNETTKDEVLRREIPQMEGTWVSTELVKEGREKILRRGFGTTVDIETPLVPGTSDQMDVIYKIEEGRLGQIGAGLGYSITEGLMFNFSVSQENFFGTGKGVDFAFDKSKASTNYSVGYMDPCFTVDGIGMGVSAYRNKVNLSKTTDISDYTTDTMGGEVRWVFPVSQYEALRFSTGYDDTHLKLPHKHMVAQEILDFLKQSNTRSFKEATLGFGWDYNSLNQRIFPTRGMSQSAGIRVVVPGANQQYYKASYEIAAFYPLSDSEHWIINMLGNLGYGDGYGNRNGQRLGLPFYRHFMAGGTRFVRGFEENSLGPKDSQGLAFGGNALIAGTAALIFPNPINPDIKSVRTALFFDAGQVYDTRYRYKKVNGVEVLENGKKVARNVGGLRYSVGISLSWHTPLGGAPLSFSLAKTLNAKKEDKKRAFTFWMSTNF